MHGAFDGGIDGSRFAEAYRGSPGWPPGRRGVVPSDCEIDFSGVNVASCRRSPFGPPPPVTLEVTPSDEEVEFFSENGFLVVDRITTDEELAWLTEIYEHIFAPENAAEPGAPVDRTNGPGEDGPANLSQAFMPEIHHPELLQTTYVRNARRYAAALLGVAIEQLSCWGHMIRKLPGGRDAPWHQDEAYWDPELAYHALGCWLPLHAVSEAMGAMQFIPGSHKTGCGTTRTTTTTPPLHILVADDVDPSRKRRVPAACRRGDVPLPTHPSLHRAQHHEPAPAGIPDRVPGRTDTPGRRAIVTLGRRQPRRHRTHPDQRLFRRRDLRQALSATAIPDGAHAAGWRHGRGRRSCRGAERRDR